MLKENYKEKAIDIANYINLTRAEDRGLLFLYIAKELRKQHQHFTASLFESIAQQYGDPEENKI